ncbi:MAG: hypothetical protein ACP5O2_08225 [Bacteroidales bacterium]
MAGSEGIEIVNNQGKEVKKFKVGGNFEYFEDTPEGILYINKKQMGLLDPQTFEMKGEPTTINDAAGVKAKLNSEDGLLYLATDKELFTVSREGQAHKLVDYKFEEGEYPSKIEFMADGILLSAAQNAIKLSREGKEIYKVYYKSPAQSTGKKLLAGLGAEAMSALTVAAALEAGTRSNIEMLETLERG